MAYALAPHPGPLGLYTPLAPQPSEVAFGPAGWHGPNDIQTLVGLAGTYLWSENPLLTTQINFVFNPGMVGSQGVYAIRRGVLVVEQGSFFCVPNNPAVGFAFINLLPSGQMFPRTSLIQGMMTDGHWKISTMMLNRLGPNGPIPPLFSAIRIV